MHQQWTVAAEETVDVPAGRYHTFRFHCEQPWPISIAIDRWFAPGFGFVKDVTTTRGPTGRLLNRTTMVLTKLGETPPPRPAATATAQPHAAPSPVAAEPPADGASPDEAAPRESAESAGAPRVRLELSSEREGEPTTEFSSD